MGGLEPPQISLHAPQTCASTIPPHRQVISIIIDYIADNTAGQLFFIWGTVSQTPKLNASAFLEHTYAFLVFAKPSLARLKLRQVRFLKRQSSTLASHVCSCKICTTCKFLRRFGTVSALGTSSTLLPACFTHLCLFILV